MHRWTSLLERTELKYFNVIYRYDALIRGGEDLVGGGFVDYVDMYLAELTSVELGLDPDNCVDNGGVFSILSGRYDHVDQNQGESRCVLCLFLLVFFKVLVGIGDPSQPSTIHEN